MRMRKRFQISVNLVAIDEDARGHGNDTITDFDAGAGTADAIDISSFGLNSLADVQALATDVGSDVLIDFGGGSSIRLLDVSESMLSNEDFIF